jgi:hypothetical protein
VASIKIIVSKMYGKRHETKVFAALQGWSIIRAKHTLGDLTIPCSKYLDDGLCEDPLPRPRRTTCKSVTKQRVPWVRRKLYFIMYFARCAPWDAQWIITRAIIQVFAAGNRQLAKSNSTSGLHFIPWVERTPLFCNAFCTFRSLGWTRLWKDDR